MTSSVARGETGSILVTGCSTGIGEACALYLDRLGFQVYAGVRTEEDAERLGVRGSGQLRPLLLDVTDEDQIAACVEAIARQSPGGLDGLVNNAGIAVAGPLEAVPLAEFRRQIEVNLVGQVALTQAVLPQVRHRRGRLVFISSDNGRIAAPCLAAYSASKHAIEAIADALRLELRAAGVRVVLIEPGAIRTPIWEKTRQQAVEMRRRYPAGLEEVYGPLVDRVEMASIRQAERGIAPNRVAKKVAVALTVRRPRARYAVGLDARLALLAARLAPTSIRDRIVARAAGLD